MGSREAWNSNPKSQMQALFPGVYVAEMQIPSEALLILIQTQVALDLEDQMAHASPTQNASRLKLRNKIQGPYLGPPAVLPPWNLIFLVAALKRRIWRFCSRFKHRVLSGHPSSDAGSPGKFAQFAHAKKLTPFFPMDVLCIKNILHLVQIVQNCKRKVTK